VSDEEQALLKSSRILLGGAGIGSIIAECALRFGFEDIVIVDGDKVELSNLNRQNYVKSDIGKPKAEALAKRLLRINPKANIKFHNTFIDKKNVKELLEGVKIAINALDFKSDIPFLFDELCSQNGIPVLHPYNFGWGSFLTIIKPGGYQLTELSTSYKDFELTMAKFVARFFTFWGMENKWLDEVIERYVNEPGELPPPQLSIASWSVAGYCVNAMFDILTGRDVKYFPKFYFSSLRCDTT
jgi:molybdopterin/thiamine biosynthesis adenylyltransferase